MQCLRHMALDFVLLQETHVTSCRECEMWFSPYGFLTSCFPGTAHSCGTVILYHPVFEASNVFFDAAGRFIMVYFKHNGSSFGIGVCAK